MSHVDWNDARLPKPEDDKDAQIAKLKTVVEEQAQRIADLNAQLRAALNRGAP